MKAITYTLIKHIFENFQQFVQHPSLADLHLHMDGDRSTMISGGMAMVAKMVGGDGRHYAVKIWLSKPDASITERYTRMEQRTPLSAYILYGDYLPGGVQVGTHALDVYRSPWLDQYTSLHEYVGFHKDDPAILRRIAEKCEGLFRDMKREGVVHGDLHPDNIKIGQDQDIKLIDLDSLSFSADLPEESSIKGLPVFQHPQRTKTIYPNTDDVSMLSILTSIWGAACDVDYFQKYDYSDDLGITQIDLGKPESSDLLQSLKQEQGKTGTYARLLLETLTQPYARKKSLFVKSAQEASLEQIRTYFKKKSSELHLNKIDKSKEALGSIRTYFDALRS